MRNLHRGKLMKISSKIRNLAFISITVTIVGCQGAATQEETPAPTEAAPTPTATIKSDSNYQVERGDSLWGISGKAEIYGNPYQWPLIYKKNSDKITDADLIYPGQIFAIDNNPSSADVATAVEHAKTRGRWSIGVVEDSDKAYLRR